jgi:hypothetical protein
MSVRLWALLSAVIPPLFCNRTGRGKAVSIAHLSVCVCARMGACVCVGARTLGCVHPRV